jgi:predicted small secreted protein
MTTNCLTVATMIVLASVALTSCNTATGRGAAIGAGTGAVVGGPVGAAVGAAGGALIGAAVDENRAAQYGPAPRGGYPMAVAAENGMYYSPYTHKVYDLRGVPSGGLVRDTDTNHLFRKP